MPARANTDIEAANLALALLHEPSIGSFTDNQSRARAVNKWYGTALDQALREEYWNFAKTYFVPAAATEKNPGPLQLQYPLPLDFVEMRSVVDASTDEWEVATSKITMGGAQVEALVLLTNLTAPTICYTRRVTDVSLWDSSFLIAFAAHLGHLAAREIGKSATRVADLRALAEDMIGGAAQIDARERAPSEISRDTSWIRARRAGSFR